MTRLVLAFLFGAVAGALAWDTIISRPKPPVPPVTIPIEAPKLPTAARVVLAGHCTKERLDDSLTVFLRRYEDYISATGGGGGTNVISRTQDSIFEGLFALQCMLFEMDK